MLFIDFQEGELMVSINDVETTLLLDLIASSDGDIALATERLNTHLKVDYGTISEYDVTSFIGSLDSENADTLASKLRTLLTVKVYNLIVTTTEQLQIQIGDLRPSELARMHSSLISVFNTLTAPATKSSFDLDRELEDIAREFPQIPREEIRAELKKMERKAKLKAIK